jgi:hypothetical protein
VTQTLALPVRGLALRTAVAVLLVIRPAAARAQVNTTADVPGSLQDRLDPATRGAVQAMIDSAAAGGVPTGPLVAKALEGAAKHAPGERIVVAVRSLAGELAVARRALGTDADEASLVAGAAALRASVSGAFLGELREARPGVPVAWPLSVLADLVSHGVPADTAGAILLALARSDATDAVFSTFEQQVLRDVGAGVPPGAAALARAPAGLGRGAMPPAAPRPAAPRGRPAAPDIVRHP